tara:strand:- start:564 stop:698 length:135 start_codon:yes stop_codon:yes gene_type:complete
VSRDFVYVFFFIFIVFIFVLVILGAAKEKYSFNNSIKLHEYSVI